ncbi:MAG: hypothetical protein RI973_363, partial [Bacteroidota bacterium]
SWTATNDGASGWLEKCFDFEAQAATAELRLAGSGPMSAGGMLLDDMTLWSCPSDNEPPVVQNPPPAQLSLDCSLPLPGTSLLATDNCQPSVTPVFSEITLPNPCLYSLERTWTFTDNCGNETVVEQTITVTDLLPPVFTTAPANLSVSCSSDYLSAFNAWVASNGGAQATDNCDASLSWQAVFSLPPQGSCSSTPVVFFVSDDCGNVASEQAVFTTFDNQPPVLLQPAQNQNVPCSANEAFDFSLWLVNNGYASAEDLCGSVTWTNNHPGTPPAAFTPVTFTATDLCGNSTSVTGVFSIDNVPDTTYLNATTCDPAQSGTFVQYLNGQQGCDSVVITTVSLSAADTTLLFDTDCNSANAGVFVQNLVNAQGCDSTVILTVTYSAADTTLLYSGSCDPAAAGVSTMLLTNQSGCDSVVVSTVEWLGSAGVFLQSTTCDPAAAGVFENNLTNQYGCDSLVITTVAYLPSDTALLFLSSCNPADTGVFQLLLTNQLGCDSLVITTIGFAAADTVYIFSATCDPAAAGQFSEVFVNQFGCDSIVIETVTLLSGDTTLLISSTCDPGAAGIFTLQLSNQDGCDSIVIETVTLLSGDTTLLSSSTCDPGAAGIFTQQLSNQDGCDSVVIETVTLLSGDTTLLSSSTCDPGTAGIFTQQLSNQDGCDSVVIETVTLLSGDTTLLSSSTCDPGAAGIFTLQLSNQDGCDSVVIETVTLLSGDTTLLSSSTCDPGAAGIFTQQLSNQNGCDSVVIETVTLLPGDTTLLSSSTCDPGAAGIFTQQFTNQNGCDSVVVTAVLLTPPPLLSLAVSDFNGYGVKCAGGSEGQVAAQASGASPFAFVWSNGDATPVLAGLPAGSYSLTVSDVNGCTASATASLQAPPPLEMDFSVNEPGCFDQNGGAITALANGGVPPYEYSLNGGAFVPDNAFTELSAGTYEVLLSDANGCALPEIIWVNAPLPVAVELGSDLLVQLGEELTLTALVNLPYDSLAAIEWSSLDSPDCPACLSQPVAPLISTTYLVSVTANNGCRDEDELTVFVDRRIPVFVPNVFSPNGDGLNDMFTIFANSRTVLVVRDFRVFSRWGELLFERSGFQPNSLSEGWDGRHRGELLDPAVFVWMAEVELADGSVEVLKGEVLLTR